jgi:hypothetical protein
MPASGTPPNSMVYSTQQIKNFGARPVASLYPGGPKTFMIADQAAKDIFSSYLF